MAAHKNIVDPKQSLTQTAALVVRVSDTLFLPIYGVKFLWIKCVWCLRISEDRLRRS